MTDAPRRRGLRRALLLIDFQDDFLSAEGRLPVCRDHVAPVLAAAGHAIAQARAAGDLVAAVGNEFRPSDHLGNWLRRHASLAGAPGSRWTTMLPRDAMPYFPKWAGSAFVNPKLEAWLVANDVGALGLCGLFAKACIAATATAALERHYQVSLVYDAIACQSDVSRDRALARLADRGARLVRTDDGAATWRFAPQTD